MTYYSQIGQDRYYIEEILPNLKIEHTGRFLDVGAYDGIFTSNTYTLESELGWTGILVEANPVLADLCRSTNRLNSEVREAVVWSSVMDLDFEYPTHGQAILSRVAGLPHNSEYFKEEFQTPQTYKVRTTTLKRILGPGYHHFDYASFDIEGAELEALRGIDWNRTQFGFMTVEYGDRQDYLNDLIGFMSAVEYRVHRLNQFEVEFVPM
jgi:FkbM family methyltransferase